MEVHPWLQALSSGPIFALSKPADGGADKAGGSPPGHERTRWCWRQRRVLGVDDDNDDENDDDDDDDEKDDDDNEKDDDHEEADQFSKNNEKVIFG